MQRRSLLQTFWIWEDQLRAQRSLLVGICLIMESLTCLAVTLALQIQILQIHQIFWEQVVECQQDRIKAMTFLEPSAAANQQLQLSTLLTE